MAESGGTTLAGAQTMVDLQKLLGDVFDNVLTDFVQLQGDPDQGDRKHQLLQHLHGARQQVLRSLALINWKPWKVLAELVEHDRVLDLAASHVRTMGLVVASMRQQATGRIMAGAYLNAFDVNTALEVLTTGTYQELPSIILHRPPLFQPPPASLTRQRSRLAHVTHLIRSRLVQVALPPGLKVVSVGNGTAVLRAEGLYEAKLTLVPSEPLPGIDDDGAEIATAANPDGAAGMGAAGGAEAAAPGEDVGAAGDWTEAAAAAAAGDPVAATAGSQRWKWRLIHFVLLIGVPFYDPRQPGQILNTCNFHMVLAADNAAYLRRQRRTQSQQGLGGAAVGAGAGAAHSTVSESAATPATSGLPGQQGQGQQQGGSLAAAVRRAEDDEVSAPMAVMHAILTDVAGRLLADELAAAARALTAPGSRWQGHITVKPSQLLHPGVRIEYWVQAPPLLNQRALSVTAPGEDHRTGKPGPPYLELGMGEGGCVEVLHSPSRMHKPMAVSKLRLDTFRVNVEEVLMRAANMSAQFQLLQIRKVLKENLLQAMGLRAPTMRLTSLARQLWCRDGHALAQPGTEEEDCGSGGTDGAASTAAAPMDVDGGPSTFAAAESPASAGAIPPPTAPPPEVSGLLATVAPQEETAGALVLLNAPVLEYLVAGTTELKIGKHLFSGRLTLRPGQDERDEGSLHHAAEIAVSEDAVNAAANNAYNTAAADGYPASRALTEACAALCRVLQRTHNSTDATHFIQAARRASLHISRLPNGMLEAFTAANPGLAIDARPSDKVATWALQCVPFPPNFPPLEPVPHDTLPLRVPQCLTFFLQSRLSLTSPHVLVVCSCNRQLMPTKVLSCIPVPPSTYRLPDHVMAAYMAVSVGGGGNAQGGQALAAGQGGHQGGYGSSLNGAHPHSGNGGGGAHPHSPPHSGGSSPRGQANGMDHMPGHSPETSPVRDAGPAGLGLGGLHHRTSAGGACGGTTTEQPAGAGPIAGHVSGQPSLPSASSPPHSASRWPSYGGAPPAGGTSGGPQQHRGGGGGAGGRPTGQQVAVMLAHQQLSSVVRWCRRRMVWEVLLVQLQAVGAAFVELCSPTAPCNRVRVTRVAGTALPCAIARRHGLVPSHVGPACLELELGPDALAGQVTARLWGKFLCAPSCAPVPAAGGRASACGAASGGSGGDAATTGFVLDEDAPAPERAGGAGRGGSGVVGGGARALMCLRRQYCLERGDSALTLVQEVAAVIRMQTLLARLEMTVRAAPATGPQGAAAAAAGQEMPQRLAVLARSVASQASGGGSNAGLRPLQHHNHQQQPQQQQQQHGPGGGGAYDASPPVKRIKTEPGCAPGPEQGSAFPNANGSAGWNSTYPQQPAAPGFANGIAGVAAAGGHPQSHSQPAPAAAAHSSPFSNPALTSSGGLTWHWPLVGTLTLEHYSCSAAAIRYTPFAASSSRPLKAAAPDVAAGPTTMPPPPLVLHITWAPRDVQHMCGGGAAAGPAPSTPPQTPGGHGAALAAAAPFGLLATPAAQQQQLQQQAQLQSFPPTLQHSQPAGCNPALLLAEAVAPSTRHVQSRPGEAFGHSFCDVALCTASCSSGHSLPLDFLHVLEEFAEAGEEGKLLDALAVAAWPLAGFCAALRPAVLGRYGLAADVDVRSMLSQPPFCHRIVCRRRAAGGGHVLIDLLCQAVGRSYLKVSIASSNGGGGAGGDGGAGGTLERTSTSGAVAIKQEVGAGGAGTAAGTSGSSGAPSCPAVLQAVKQLATVRLGGRGVHVSVGGRGAVYTGLGHRPTAVPGPGAPLWLLVPNDCVQIAVELVLGVLNS